MTYLVDANVLSEAAKPAPNARVVAWLTRHERELVIDAVILGELRLGILALPVGRKRTKLEHWFEVLASKAVCLSWDSAIARRWAKLVIDLRRKGQTLPLLDSMIAATALEHDLTLVTRNLRDFERTGVKLFNPFD